MITLISPAKTLDFETPIITQQSSNYLFDKEAVQVMKKLKSLSRKKISALMSLSENLSDINYQRFQMWTEKPEVNRTRPAIFMFKGEVYLGLDGYSLSETDLDFAQSNLRILSGLYVYLKPLDVIQAYRLEMGTKLNMGVKNSLYEFWGEKIANQINLELENHSSNSVINLASNEYAKAAKLAKISGAVITPVFKDFKNGDYKVISFFAKKARGVMARWIIQQKLEFPEEIIGFSEMDYRFNANLSSAEMPVFTRD
jgi:cytoplasmic iron level regulating protein YaaA (DUF328/UPF0246 family)